MAQNVLRGTDFAFRLALQSENVVVRTLRRSLLPRIVASAFVQRKVSLAISELAVARREINGYLEP